MKATFFSRAVSKAVMLVVVSMIAYGFSMSFTPDSKSSHFSLIKSAHAETEQVARNNADLDSEDYGHIKPDELRYFLKS